MCSGCRKPISKKDKKSKKYEEGVTCPNCYDKLTESQKSRFRMRQNQIYRAKLLGKNTFFKKNLNKVYLSKSIKLTKDPIWSLLKNVTIPASTGSLFQTFYNLVDTWFAGKISAEAIAAIAKSFPIYFVIIAVGVGIGAATNACIGNLLGEKI